LLEVIFSRLDSFYIFRNQWIVHILIILLCKDNNFLLYERRFYFHKACENEMLKA